MIVAPTLEDNSVVMWEHWARLWTADRKQIYAMDDNNKVYQKWVKLDGHNNEYIYTSHGREREDNDWFVYEWANWREYNSKDGRVYRVQGQKMVIANPVPEEEQWWIMEE